MRKKTCFKALLTMLLLAAALSGMTVCVSAADYLVDDAAMLFDEEENKEISGKLKQLAEDTGCAFAVVTTDDAQGRSSMNYADDYYDALYDDADGVLYLIDMDNRNIWISTSGSMIRKNSDADIDAVIDAGYDELRAGKYGSCILKMLKKQRKVLGLRSLEWYEALIAAVLGVLAAVLTGGIIVGKYKLKFDKYQYSYNDNGALKLTVREDRLVNQIVTHRKIVKNTGSSGGHSSTHTSSSGNTHGGGGRSF